MAVAVYASAVMVEEECFKKDTCFFCLGEVQGLLPDVPSQVGVLGGEGACIIRKAVFVAELTGKDAGA